MDATIIDGGISWIQMAQPPWNEKNQQQLLEFAGFMRLGSRGSLATSAHININVIAEDVRIPNIFHVMGSSAYASLLQQSIRTKSLSHGKLIHALIIYTGLNPQMYLHTKLVIMYAKCGSLLDARRIFDEMPKRNVVSWTAMMAAYARHGQYEKALALFYQMRREGIPPDMLAFVAVLPACADLASLKDIHEDITGCGFQSDTFVGTALLGAYAKFGNLEDARQVFDEMPERNIVCWTALIAGYAQNGQLDGALKMFQKLPERDMVSWNAMISGYVEHGGMDEALTHFQKMPERNVVSWTAMISGCAQEGLPDEALKLFQKMPERRMISWNVIIAGYAQNGRVDDAWKLFQQMVERDIVSWNALIAAYSQSNHVDEALKLFQKMADRDVVSWTAMIAGYVQSEHIYEALGLFQQMQLTGVKPDSVTFTSVLAACASLTALKHGKDAHKDIIQIGLQRHISVGNSLLDMYAKCGSIDDARQVFDKMPARDIVSWNALIAGYDHNGQVNEGLKLFQKMPERDEVSWNAMISGSIQNGYFNKSFKIFRQMQLTDVNPNSVTFASILAACAYSADMTNGRVIHKFIIRGGFQSHLSIGSALVDMYAKCGLIEDARQVFGEMPERDIISWNAMIVGYAKHGFGTEVFQLFKKMQHSGLRPNDVTFIGVLSACSHAGLVDEGWQYFDCMSRDYNITPAIEHYCCIVDLLGRAGSLNEAVDFINKMPIKPNAVLWGSLLGACRIHANTELGEHVAERLFELDPKNASFYVLLSNMYATSGRWHDVEKVRKMMKNRRVEKPPGCSWIEINNEVCSFLVRDRPHFQVHKIYADSKILTDEGSMVCA